MSGRGTRRHKWALEYASRSKSEGRQLVSSVELSPPLGYIDRTLNESSGGDNSPNLVVKKSWEIALGPIKQIPMNLFIMWMAGNSISIFPIMMVGMMFIRPMQALLAIQQTFKMIEGSQANQQKVVYLLGNLIGLALAIYKCQVMGILPTHPSDWLAFVEPQKRMEWSGGGMVL